MELCYRLALINLLKIQYWKNDLLTVFLNDFAPRIRIYYIRTLRIDFLYMLAQLNAPTQSWTAAPSFVCLLFQKFVPGMPVISPNVSP